MKIVLIIFLFFFIPMEAFSQGLCDLKSGDEKGDFDATIVACIGQKVEVKDKSGGADIKYIFGYKGQPASQLSSIPFESGPNSEWAFAEKGNFLVLQYGKKNGKDMFACKVVAIRESNKPDISYEACNNSVISLTISNTPANNFTSYSVKWGDGSFSSIPAPVTLPYTIQKNFSSSSSTQKVLIEGLGSTLTNCPTAVPETIIMDRGDMFPRIEKIELNEDGSEASITLRGNPDAEYNIFSRLIDEQGSLTNPLTTKVRIGTFKLPIKDKKKSQCFFVGRRGAICTEYSNEICTMPFIVEAVEEDYMLTWNDFSIGKLSNTEVFTYINQVETKVIREENPATSGLVEFNGVSSPFIDNNANCNKKYCYTLFSKVISSYAGYTNSSYIESAIILQKQCVDRKQIKPTALTETIVTVNEDNSVGINFFDNSVWQLNREKYRLYRFTESNNKFKKIDSILSTSTKTFLDRVSKPDTKSYCYAIDFIDKCGSTSELSPPFCTVFLSDIDSGDIVWTAESPFGDTGIYSFEIQSYNENTVNISTVASLPAIQLNYEPDISGFEEEAKFRVRILAPDGNESYSNTISYPLVTKLLVPDAFTPNNDTYNDNLQIKGTFKEITNFDFQVYNRWGNTVFSSNDPLRTWDGNFQGFSAPSDAYTYKIYVKLKDGTEVNKAGKFLLIR